jgi:hypothetical protein
LKAFMEMGHLVTSWAWMKLLLLQDRIIQTLKWRIGACLKATFELIWGGNRKRF